MTCTCFTPPQINTAADFSLGEDGMMWMHGTPCPAHKEPAASPIWHPRLGWLDKLQETKTAAADQAVAVLQEA